MNNKPITLRVNAYAKINAYLDVTGRRDDGYHTILSHMQAVTLADVLTLCWEPTHGIPFSAALTCSDAALSVGEDNLVCRAALALAARAKTRGVNTDGRLSVVLQKNIPMAAGLAGGSADAAATLRGLNELLGQPFSTDELCEVAVGLGADVPFCVRCTEHAAMTARGIGEVLTVAQPLPTHAHLVVACHGEGVSTPWAYRRLDEGGTLDGKTAERKYLEFLNAVSSGNLAAIGEKSYNCFEDVVLPEREAVSMLMQGMRRQGATFVRMSGSGPSVVGYFEHGADALACVARLQRDGIRAVACEPLG